MIKKTVFFLTLLLVHSANFSHAVVPDWVKAKPVSRDYYIGVGSAEKFSGDYVQIAQNSALADLASEISISIDSEILNQFTENDRGLEQEFKSKVITSTSASLEGYERIGTWESKTHYWVCYRLSKVAYAQQREAKRDAARSLAVDFIEKAEMQNADFSSKMRGYVHALGAITPYIGEPLEAELKGRKCILNNEIVYNLQNLLGQVRLEPVAGKIAGKVGKPLQRPLQLRAAAGEIPIVGLPLRFRFIRGGGDVLGKTTTDDRGMATAKVVMIQASDKMQIIRCEIDLAAWIKEDNEQDIVAILLHNLDTPGVNFIIEVSSLSIAVECHEINMGEEVGVGFVEPALKKALADKGYSFTEDVSQADLLIEIRGETRKGAEVFGQFTAFLDLNVAVTDMVTGEEIVKHSLSRVKGIDLSYENAGLKALENGGKRMVDEIVPKLLEVVQR